MNKALSSLTLLLALAGVSTVSQAQGDPAKGEAKAAMCIGCHGIIGYQATFPEVHKVPMISGQTDKYIAASLVAYQKGDRKHPTMRGIAASLTEQDIADLAAYYSQHGKAPAAPAALAKEVPANLKDRMAACVACHGANFSSPIDPSYPRIAGQHADFLAAALRAYQTDGNPHVGRSNAMMRGQLVQEADGKKKYNYTPAEIRQMAQYLASLPGQLRVVPQSGRR
jgi:cytochrome c553